MPKQNKQEAVAEIDEPLVPIALKDIFSSSRLPPMKIHPSIGRVGFCLLSLSFAATVLAHEPVEEKATPSKVRALKTESGGKVKLDRSGKPRRGKASYYHRKFAGRKMADGTPMDPNSNIAASKTLPLGSKVRVTNLNNGKSEVVEIRDRGPYIPGRIVDLTPKTAKELDIYEEGVALVEVTPLEVPQADGSVKKGIGAASAIEMASGN